MLKRSAQAISSKCIGNISRNHNVKAVLPIIPHAKKDKRLEIIMYTSNAQYITSR